MKKILIFSLLLIVLASCAQSHNVSECIDTSNQVGFWSGTWHGMITFFSFIGSLFDENIAVYAVNNNGHWYDFGFVGGFFMMLRFVVGFVKGASK